MDKKNTMIGVGLLAVALSLMIFGPQPEPTEVPVEAAPPETGDSGPASVQESPSGPAPETGSPAGSSNGGEGGIFSAVESKAALPKDLSSEQAEERFTLENGTIRVTFTTKGGAIHAVEMIAERAERLAYPQTKGADEPYQFNEGAPIPALAISLDPDGDLKPDEYAPPFRMISLNEAENYIIFAYEQEGHGRIIRSYQLQGPESELDPYVIQHDTKFVNTRETPLDLEQLYLNVGTAPPTKGDDRDEFLNFGYAIDGDSKFVRRGKFDASGGFFGIGSRRASPFIAESFGTPSLSWAASKNQFFTSVLTPVNTKGTGYFTRPVDLTETVGEDFGRSSGITGSMAFDLGTLQPGTEKLLRTEFYVGPKEFFRLESLGDSQGEIMQFGYMGLISKFLLLCLNGLHAVLVHVTGSWAWGFAIIALTVIIKALLWPLTRIQVRSAKRMAELQGPMKEIQEKHKDNPEEKQKAVMKLFQDHKVNPAAGCLPILVQMPIFIGLFFMLRTSSELRFAPFFWIGDLSVPDTLFSIGGFPINLLPLLMVGAQVAQMRLTPSPSADPSQKMILQFMPVIFLLICYSFPAGVVLYWTVQTALGIVQQLVTNRIKDDEDRKIEAELADQAKQKRKHVAAAKKTTQSTNRQKGKRKR